MTSDEDKNKAADDAVKSIVDEESSLDSSPHTDDKIESTRMQLSEQETAALVGTTKTDEVDAIMDLLSFEDKKAWLDAVYFGDGRVTFRMPLVPKADLEAYQRKQTYASFTSLGSSELDLVRRLSERWAKAEDKHGYVDVANYMDRATQWLQLNSFSKIQFDDKPDTGGMSKEEETSAWDSYINDVALPRLSFAQRVVVANAHRRFMDRLAACAIANSRGTF